MPEHEIDGVLSFQSINQMSKKNKGAIGEALAGIWLKEQIKNDPSLITDQNITEPEPTIWFSHLGKHRCQYGKVDEDGVEEVSWEPDYSFYVTLPDYNVRREILIEAKTGRGKLQRNQLEVMKLVAQEEGTTVYLCRIGFDEEQATVRYQEIGENEVTVEVEEGESHECYDCGTEIDPETARLTDRDGSAVYVCPEQCQ